jgi:hypothetical protein
MLSTSTGQVYALVRRGELRAVKLGGRGQWRCAVDVFVERLYAETQEWIEQHKFTGGTETDDIEPDAAAGSEPA